MTDWASNINIWQKVHLDLVDAVTLAGFTTSTFNIEREATRFVAANLGFRLFSKKLANLIKDASISSWVRTRSATDWRLVNYDTFIKVFDTFNIVVCTGDSLGAVEASKKLVG